MKKQLLFLITLLITGVTLLGQTSITLTFTGRDQHNAHVRLDNVTIQNLTREWTESIFFPDTVYTLTVGTGVDDYAKGNDMQVMPNPFDGKTRLNLYSVKGEPAKMVIVDVTGKKCAEYQGNLSQGDNYFEILLTTPQTYILSVQTADGTHSVKMVNTGRAGSNQITLVGGESNVTKVKISSSKSHIFELGDEMRYTGYSQQSNGLIPSNSITQSQSESEEIVLNFELDEVVELPIVSTIAVSNISFNTATTGGNVLSDGGATVTDRGVCYSMMPNPTLAESHTNDGTGTGDFISNLTNLIENTTYYVRAYATNSAGTAYGNEVTFTTTCGGFQVSIMGDTTITYGQSTTLVATGAASYVWNTGDTTALITVTPTTTTTYMVTGESSTGCFSSASVTVVVSPILPTVTTSTVTNITTTGAMCGGEVVSEGGANVTMRGVCWSTTPNPTVTDSHTSDGTGTGTFVSNLTNLIENTTYYVRAYATNSAGTAYGNEVTFTTICEGFQISIMGDTTITYGQSTTLVATGAASYVWNTGNTTALITVTPTTTTTYMVTGESSTGCFSSASVTVVVSPILPTVTTSTVTNITSTGAMCGGEVVSEGGANVTMRGVCWSTTPNPTVTDSHTSDGTGTGTFVSNLTNLIENTTYYVRAYATNSAGTAYGNEVTFTTICEGFQVSIMGDTTITYGQSTTLIAIGADSYVWNTGDTTAFITVTPTTTTTYTVTGESGTGCFSSASVTVEVSTTVPIVTTSTVSNITSTEASCGGVVTSNGGANVTMRGVCWSMTPNPTVTDNLTVDGTGTGTFTSLLTNLVENTTYYVRAYATNSIGIAYGQEVSFTTLAGSSTAQPCPNAATATDYDGNVYNTVQLGNQCWMKENLRTTRYADGTVIAVGTSSSNTTPYRYAPNNDTSNVNMYGYLYNWAAVMNGAASSNANPSKVQGICPTGWHVPSGGEWSQLTDYVGSHSEYDCGYNYEYIAKALASTTGWQSSTYPCAVGNNPSANNATGFSALPAGGYDGSDYYSFGSYTFFWNATGEENNYANGHELYNTSSSMEFNGFYKYKGGSVRCVRNELAVTTFAATNVAHTTATLNGMISIPDYVTIIAQGFQWKQDTASNYQTVNVTGSDMSYNLTGLTAHTTYLFRAFVTTGDSTIYGDELSFTTRQEGDNDGLPCSGSSTVTDYDGNIYNTVQIGNQCWLKENLRTTRFADGTVIEMGTSSSYTTPYRYAPNNDTNKVDMYGYLYNWAAVMNGMASSNANPSGVQGICPTGWHVPSDVEWTKLTGYVGSQSRYVCGNDSANIAKALAVISGWNSSWGSDSCTVGVNPDVNNKTGFSALPAGYNSYGSSDFGFYAYFWSATERNDSYQNSRVYNPYIYYDNAYVGRYDYNGYKNYGFSVRCIRDELVYTLPATNVAPTSAILNGMVSNPDNVSIMAQGFQWKQDTASNYQTVSATGSNMSYNLTDLTPNTTYLFRAFVTTSNSTVYGEELSFTTRQAGDYDGLPCIGNSLVTDYDSNEYNTVQIGSQCWMKENLRTTHYANGTSIALGSNTSTTTAYRSYPNDDQSTVPTYGYLYNWKAVMDNSSSSSTNPSGVQGICPTGWHVPSDAEWTKLTDYVSSQSEYVCGNDSSFIAKALASTTGWESSSYYCTPGDNPSTNNATGFSALPAGCSFYGDSYLFGESTYFWSATESSYGNVYSRFIDEDGWEYSANEVSRSSFDVDLYMFSVRCIRNELAATTSLATNVAQTSATLNGVISTPDNVSIIAQGFQWKQEMAGSYQTVNATGTFMAYNLTGLTANTTYVYRAFATAADSTVYGDELSFTTRREGDNDGLPCAGNSIVTDYDGNEYNTVQIGNQCWMKENLRTTHYAHGASIALGSSTSSETAYCYYPNNDQSNVPAYGYLYNWMAVSSYIVSLSGVQGICPTGWHVPSNEEWTQLTDYVSSQSQYVCGDNTYSIAKALASTMGWDGSSSSCTIGNNPSANNATGFSALPAGWFSNTASGFGSQAVFWSATPDMFSNNLCLMYNDYNGYGGAIYNCGHLLNHGLSVRCVRNELVYTLAATDVTQISATLNGSISNSNNVSIIAQGFQWRQDTASTYQTVNAMGSNMSYNLTGLTANTTYVYRAFVTTADSTLYGIVRSFTTRQEGDNNGLPCTGSNVVIDYDGNIYNTVQIGSQCWMKENLRVKHYSDGTTLSLGNDTSSVTPYYFYPDGDPDNQAIYGLHYNWKAAMGESASSNANPSGVQGICPTGWHLPSYAEWGVLRSYVANAEFLCDGVDENAVGKSIASSQGWNTSDTLCDIGYLPENNNLTGFSAYPAGGTWYGVSNGNHYSNPLYFGNRACFWSSTIQNDANYAYSRLLYYDTPYFYSNGYNIRGGISVRCLRDETGGGETPVDTCYLLNENFENGAIPADWTTLDSDGDGYVWSHSSSSDISASLGHNESNGFMTSASYINNVGVLTPDNWLITPAITLSYNATLSFWVCAQDVRYPAEHYGVYVTTSNNYTSPENYILLFEETIDSDGGAKTQSAWKQKTISLQGYVGQTVHIAFRHFNCSDWYYLNLDDVTIRYDDCSANGQ